MAEPEKLARVMKSFLKLVAIATVADVVPLVGENRVIVKHGLDGLNQSRNPGLRAILELSGLMNGQSPSARQVAFQIAPRINAAGRMDDAQNVIRMFLTEDPEHARRLASELHSLNQERRDTEAEIVRLVLTECEGVPVTDDQTVLVFSGLNWHRGVVGIVASRLVERFYRPVFVLSEEEGQAQGSGRSIAPFHLLDALESMPDLFTRFGGHRQAAGVSLAAESVPEFRRRLNIYAATRLTPADFQPQLAIDATVSLRELTTGPAVEELLAMAPFGFGNPAPMLAILGAEVVGAPVVMKEKHLRVHLRQGGRSLFPKAWNFAQRAADFAASVPIDAAFSVEEDRFADWAAVLRDVRPASQGDAESGGGDGNGDGRGGDAVDIDGDLDGGLVCGRIWHKDIDLVRCSGHDRHLVAGAEKHVNVVERALGGHYLPGPLRPSRPGRSWNRRWRSILQGQSPLRRSWPH